MKLTGIISFVFVLLAFTACQEPEPVIIDSSLPQGTFTAQLTGSFVEQNGTGSTGTAEIGSDTENGQFLRFGDDFVTNLATGTVTVYLSTSQDFVADPMNGNPELQLVGAVNSNGETFFKFDAAPAAKFTHVILWCGSANIPFGYAALQ
ncbi:MAG: DM13 domain-containing protein [Bacteroidota bacterium]